MSDDILVRRGLASNVPSIIREALGYWESKLAGRRMPARRDFDPVFEIPHLLPWIMLVDVLRDPLDFRYRVIGMGIAERSTKDYTGRHPPPAIQ
ncbi:PAS domain-containing protein (plasmid) [Skermanella mucosa]|uniref:PAS domain-containing protein n=1 Tax=Skermanella mucosa TaxID=1789672 RepID=UPI00192B8881|nr:PAS domain-containing protein [Skermanella mucosa]UEM24468.1 PAS domain-containing protein [Skermanella mucosa]